MTKKKSAVRKQAKSAKRAPAKRAARNTTKKATKSPRKAVTRKGAKKAERKTEHLKQYQFKPGQSGNPAGRPPGKRNFDTLVDLAIMALAEEYVKQYNKRRIKKNHITVEDVDIESDVFKQLINKARNGDMKAIDSFLDRRHGKATQPVQLGGMPGNPIEVNARVEEAKKKSQGFFKRWASVAAKQQAA